MGRAKNGKNGQLSAQNATETGKDARETGKNEQKEAKTPAQPARQLARTDWLLIQHAIAVEGLAYAAAQRVFGVNATTIRMRAKAERWLDKDIIRTMPSIEEIIIMRNEREILRALKSMSGQLEDALKSGTEQEASLALQKLEMVGKTARTAQSAARAASVTAVSKRKVKAHGRSKSDGDADRAAIKAELDRLAAQAPKGSMD